MYPLRMAAGDDAAGPVAQDGEALSVGLGARFVGEVAREMGERMRERGDLDW